MDGMDPVCCDLLFGDHSGPCGDDSLGDQVPVCPSERLFAHAYRTGRPIFYRDPGVGVYQSCLAGVHRFDTMDRPGTVFGLYVHYCPLGVI